MLCSQSGPQLCKDMAELTAIQHANASSCCRPPQASCAKPAPSPGPIPPPVNAKECPNHQFNGSFVPWVRAVNASNVYGVKEGVHNVGVSSSVWNMCCSAPETRCTLCVSLLIGFWLRDAQLKQHYAPVAVLPHRAFTDSVPWNVCERRRLPAGMRAAFKLHTVSMVRSCGGLGHLQSVE